MKLTTVVEVKERIENLTADIERAEKDVMDYAKKMGKVKKIGEVKHIHNMIKLSMDQVNQLKGFLEKSEAELIKLERQAEGMGPVMEFLEAMLEDDLEWHKNLVDMYAEKGYKKFSEMLETKQITKTAFEFARTSKEEAEKIFSHDLDIRYAKLKLQLENKVGEIKEIIVERNDNGKFDGKVTGSEGVAYLETIVAGGYNVQRAHYRTIVT